MVCALFNGDRPRNDAPDGTDESMLEQKFTEEKPWKRRGGQ
jgi:hypothetical protein